MKKTAIVFFEYLGITFIISIAGILLLRFLSLDNLLTNLAYWFGRGIVIAVIVYAIRRYKDKWSLKDLGFRIHQSWGKDIWFGFIGFCALYIVLFPLEIIHLSDYADSFAKRVNMFPDMPTSLLIPFMTLISLVFGFITGAWHEEIWYRGYIQGVFSKKIAPAVGFFISFIPFGLTHHLSHPNYSLLMIMNVLISGAMFCFIYYATGSLLASMTTHTLCNVIPIYSAYIFSEGYVTMAYLTSVGIRLIMLGLCIRGRKELKELFDKTKQIFSKSGNIHIVQGIILGLVVFLIAWGRNIFADELKFDTRIVVYGVFGIVLLGISFFINYKEKEQ